MSLAIVTPAPGNSTVWLWHRATSTKHFRAALLCRTSWCAVAPDRRNLAAKNTVNNAAMLTLHIRLLLLPASEAHERARAQLMTTCHNRRCQSFCERNGASVPHIVMEKIQFGEGAVCLSMFCGAAITDLRTQTNTPTIASAHLFLIHANECCCVSSMHVTCSTHVLATGTTQ